MVSHYYLSPADTGEHVPP